MVDKEKAYKKVLLHRSVLDSLRVYLDVSEMFLQRVDELQLLTPDELIVVKGLGWPSNRNELLQNLIRKDWTEEKFEQFCSVLKETQSNQLSDVLIKKAGEIIGQETIVYQTETTVLDGYLKGLDDQLGDAKLSMQAKNAVRGMLKEKDQEIRQAQSENSELRMTLKLMSQENHALQHQITNLDSAVNDTLAVLHFETQPDNPGHGMFMVKDRLERQTKEIQIQRDENKRLREVVAGLKDDINMLTTEAMSLKSINTNLGERLESLSTQTTKKINSQHDEIESLKKQLADKKDKLLYAHAQLRDTTNKLQGEIKVLKETLAQTNSELKTTIRQRETLKKELEEVTDRIRKLMTKLGMANDIDKLGLSIDHARNLSYVTRRQGGGSQMGQQIAHGNSILPEVLTPDSGAVLAKKQRMDYMESGSSLSGPNVTPRNPSRHAAHEEHVCLVCHKIYDEAKNFPTSCIHHEPNAVKLHMGTELEVWSCCRSRDTIRGCKMEKHVHTAQIND